MKMNLGRFGKMECVPFPLKAFEMFYSSTVQVGRINMQLSIVKQTLNGEERFYLVRKNASIVLQVWRLV